MGGVWILGMGYSFGEHREERLIGNVDGILVGKNVGG